jgi:tripartite-type tricarboxylate transporter receptor subunit TctC
VLAKLDNALAKAVTDPDFLDQMKRLYMPVAYMNRAEVNKEVPEMSKKIGEKLKKLAAEEAKGKK